jgi:SSS family transporter
LKLIDWVVLLGSLAFIVTYGVWRNRHQKDMQGYLLASRQMPWWAVALSIMATQASAITFLSTPGQAYADGMRFIQFYFGLPLAMVVLSITAVPIFHNLKVYTAYEYLEGRFDLKTRTLASSLFLIQRGMATGLTIYAPAVILSVLLGWSISITTAVTGILVVTYTAWGGAKAVNETQLQQVVVIMAGMVLAFIVIIRLLPADVSFVESVAVAGAMGRLKAIDLSFDWTNRYNIWSGLIGGFFLALSYFGTDQSQVGRYLTGRSVAQSRLGLLFNGLAKVPMQFLILFVGAMVFAFYQFVLPPVFFNPVEVAKVKQGKLKAEFEAVETRHVEVFEAKRKAVDQFLAARRSGDLVQESKARGELKQASETFQSVKGLAGELIKESDPKADRRDTNYIFLRFVLDYLPSGLIGLVLAAIIAASMSSCSAELNALATTSVVDVYLRHLRKDAKEAHYVGVSKILTVFWGALAVGFAQYASRLGTLIEAVNILGSLFYGTILGIFLVAFYVKRAGGSAVFWSAIVAEGGVLWLFFKTKVSFLWFNVAGCLTVVVLALLLSYLVFPPAKEPIENPS